MDGHHGRDEILHEDSIRRAVLRIGLRKHVRLHVPRHLLSRVLRCLCSTSDLSAKLRIPCHEGWRTGSAKFGDSSLRVPEACFGLRLGLPFPAPGRRSEATNLRAEGKFKFAAVAGRNDKFYVAVDRG